MAQYIHVVERVMQSYPHTIPSDLKRTCTCGIGSRAAVGKSVEDHGIPAVFTRRITDDDSTESVDGREI